ncbi:MAG: hybrid sensor histidine kinase/response regulator [Vibrio sp.]
MPKVPITRRRYNTLVGNELLEDFALRFTAKRARKWSLGWVANTALGIVSFLILEALGATITLNYGVTNSLWAIAGVSLVVIFSGAPICYYAAKYGVDIDLLSRGAGFGYIGSTIVSLIYASFTFIFFALEAAIMAMALELLLAIPLWCGYLISAVIVIPLVTLGIANIGRLQMWSQPLWLLLQLAPLWFVFSHPNTQIDQWLAYGGLDQHSAQFDWLLFGAASAVLLAVVAQIGEQVDFLRFLPEKTAATSSRWWAAMLIGGPGWMLFGALKIALGSLLAWLAIQQGIAPDLAKDPAHMYVNVFGYMTDNTQLALIGAGVFVIISQLKINLANAYAGSLAWSNFFSRLTHHHPGRVVWMLFNVLIALLLMQLGVYRLIEQTLQIHSVLVLSWVGCLVADLVINKPLGLSPAHIEFKRSKLYDLNPVGLGSMLIASLFGLSAHFGLYNEMLKALASYLAFAIPLLTAPLIALATRSQYYLVADHTPAKPNAEQRCVVCEHAFETEDMAHCPAYQGDICSLCCSLDVRCHDQCRPQATLGAQVKQALKPYLPITWVNQLSSSLSQFIIVMTIMSLAIGIILALAYSQVPSLDPTKMNSLSLSLYKAFALLLIPTGIISWLLVLAKSNRHLAMQELQTHSELLSDEISAHQQTSQQLVRAKKKAEHANDAKSRYLAGLSHELRTPLNVLLGYAQLLSHDPELSPQKRQYAATLERNGKHLGDLLESLLEISKIEAGRLELQRETFNLQVLLQQLVDMFRLQAEHKKLRFQFYAASHLPVFISGDQQRLRQILINMLTNAVKYTAEGSIDFSVTYRNQVARFSVKDTGIGISAQDQLLIFRPFERIQSEQTKHVSGTGLGLTISNALAELMGGEIECVSEIGQGSNFTLKMMLSEVYDHIEPAELIHSDVIGYQGARKTLLVVDDLADQRTLISHILSPLGFTILQADSAEAALAVAAKQAIDLFMLDIFMPRMNGWQLAIKLRQQHYQQPILMLSANIQELETNHQLCRYHNGYLTKPVALPLLLGKLSQLLQIDWIYQPPSASSAAQPDVRYPDQAELHQLKSYAEIGFMSAFSERLDHLERNGHQGSQFITTMREQARQCRFAHIVEQINGLIDS